MQVTYKYKVYQQNRNHTHRLEQYLRTAAWVYNHCIALHKRYYKLYHKSIGLYRMQAHLAKMKKRCYSSWSVLNSQSIQQIAQRIDEGYKKFFKHDAKHPPTFKSWRKYASVTFKQTGYTLNGNVFTINALKLRLKFFKSRELDGKIQTAQIKRDHVGDWWLCFSLRRKETIIPKAKTGKAAGFDFGMKHFLTCSDGSKIESPLVLFNSLDELRKKSKALSRKQKRSKSRIQARVSLSKLHRRISNIRSEYQWQLANTLVSKYDVLCFETLEMKAMVKLWGRKISDLAFSDFLLKLKYLCTKYGKKLICIDKWEASTKTCSHCGYKNEKMPLSIRTWTCPECGSVHNRDINAANNILKVGTSTLGGDNVRLAKASNCC